jgi:ribosomal protein L15E
METITLQQDANDKIVVSLDENIILYNAKKFFKWRKDISIKRINSLGTYDRDRFVRYLSLL